ncbi:MAG: HEAT repeat domain-containing protein [Elusimicrobiota bacterium]
MKKEKFKTKKSLTVISFVVGVVILCQTVSIAENVLLKSKDPIVRMNEIQRLGNECAKEAVPEIIKLLKDKSTGVRVNAVVALGKIGDERAIKPLKKLLKKDPSKAVRVMACQSLGQFNRKEVIKELSEAADNDDEMISSAAIRALGRIGGNKAREKLLKKAKETKNKNIRKKAVESLIETPGFGADEQEINEIERIISNIKKDEGSKIIAERAKKKLDRIKKRKKRMKNKYE